MKTLNVRLLAILLACSVVGSLALWGIYWWQRGRTAYVFLDKAEAAAKLAEAAQDKWLRSGRTSQDDRDESARQWGIAADSYGKYWDIHDDDPGILERQGLAWAEASTRAWGTAMKTLEEVLREDPTRTFSRRKVIEMALQIGQASTRKTTSYNTATTHLKVMLKQAPNDGLFLTQSAQCQMAAGKNAEAIESLKKAIEHSPHEIRAYDLLAMILRDRNRGRGALDRSEALKQADEAMRQMIRLNPDSPEAQLRFSLYLMSVARDPSVEDAWKQPIQRELIVPGVLAWAVEKPIAKLGLAKDNPDSVTLKANQKLLESVLRGALAAFDPELPMDDPDKLAQEARRIIDVEGIDTAVLQRARDEAIQAIDPPLSPDDLGALSTAKKHEVLVDAIREFFTIFKSEQSALAAKPLLQDKAVSHASKSHDLAAENLALLTATEKSDVLKSAMRRALTKQSAADLRLTANRGILVAALRETGSQGETSSGVLVDVMLDGLKNYRFALAKSGKPLSDDDLDRVIRRALADVRSVRQKEDLRALSLAVQISAWRGKPDEARRYVEEAVQSYPDRFRVHAMAAQTELQAQQPEAAAEAWLRGLKATNNHPSLLSGLTRHRLNNRELEKAGRRIKQLHACNNERVLAEWLGAQFTTQKSIMMGYLEARMDYEQGNWLAAIKGREADDGKRATRGFLRVRSGLRGNDRAQAEYYLGQCYWQLKSPDQALTAFRRALNENPGHARARLGLTEILLGKQQVGEAMDEFSRAVADGRITPAGVLIGVKRLISRNRQLPEDQRDWTSAERLLEQIPEASPEAVEVPILRAQVLAAQDQMEEAEQILDDARKENPGELRYWLTLSAIQQLQEKWEDAERTLIEAELQLGPAIEVTLARIRLLLQQEKWDEAERALAEGERKTGRNPNFVLLRADYYLGRYGQESAARLMQLAEASDLPDDPSLSDEERTNRKSLRVQILLELSRKAQRANVWGPADDLMKQAAAVSGETLLWRLTRADYLLRRLQHEMVKRQAEVAGDTTLSDEDRQAEMLEHRDSLFELVNKHMKELAENTTELSADDQVRLWRGLAVAAERIGDRDQFMTLSQRIAKAKPNDLDIRRQLIEKALAANDASQIQQWLDEIKKVEGEGALWLYGKAVQQEIKAKDGQDPLLDKALADLAKARAMRPSWSQLPLLAARIHEKQGDQPNTLKEYRKAVELGSTNTLAVLYAAQALISQRSYAEADTMLQKVRGRRTIHAAKIQAMERTIARNLGQIDKELELLQGIAKTSKMATDHIRLANILLQIMGKSGDDTLTPEQLEEDRQRRQDATVALKRAVELAANETESAQAWGSLVRLHYRAGQPLEAQKAFAEAERTVSDPIALAKMLAVMGKLGEAQAKFEAAAKAKPDDPRTIREIATFFLQARKIPLAEPYLKRIAQGEVKAKQEDVHWARRQLARIQMSQGGRREKQAALNLIEMNLADDPRSAIDLRLKASLLPTYRRREAIQTLQRLVEQGGASPNDQLALAKHHLIIGDWPAARLLLQNLIIVHRNHPPYMTTYINALLSNNELSTAERVLNSLDRLFRDQSNLFSSTGTSEYTPTELRADVLFRRRKYQQAFDLLDEFVDNGTAIPSSRTSRVRQVAATMEDLGDRLTDPEQTAWKEKFIGRAGDYYAQYVSDHLNQRYLMVAFSARQGQVGDAIQQFEEISADLAPGTISYLCQVVGNSPTANSTQIKRMENILQAAMKKLDRPATLLIALAMLRDRQGQYTEAETLYRECLAKNANDEAVMNNLAVVLARGKVKLDEALKLVNDAMAITGQAGALLDSRATVYLAMNRPTDAISDLHKAVEAEATPTRYFHLAEAYRRNKKQKEAVDAMKKAVSLGLKRESLHPIEVSAFDRLIKMLD